MTDDLTQAQIDTLSWLAGGASVEETAEALGVSRSAIVGRQVEIRRKLGAINTVHAVAIAYQRRILLIDDPDTQITQEA